jgi:hypothetical protein
VSNNGRAASAFQAWNSTSPSIGNQVSIIDDPASGSACEQRRQMAFAAAAGPISTERGIGQRANPDSHSRALRLAPERKIIRRNAA